MVFVRWWKKKEKRSLYRNRKWRWNWKDRRKIEIEGEGWSTCILDSGLPDKLWTSTCQTLPRMMQNQQNVAGQADTARVWQPGCSYDHLTFSWDKSVYHMYVGVTAQVWHLGHENKEKVKHIYQKNAVISHLCAEQLQLNLLIKPQWLRLSCF